VTPHKQFRQSQKPSHCAAFAPEPRTPRITSRNKSRMIFARETEALRPALASPSASLPIEMCHDPISRNLSRCSRRALVYLIDGDAISPVAAACVRAPPRMINSFAWRLRCG
jgi:hypothetical protein